MEQEEQNFIEYLERSVYSQATIKEYLRYYRLLKPIGLSQENINSFISKHNHQSAKFGIKAYLAFKGNRDLTIPKTKGRKSKKIPRFFKKEQLDYLFSRLTNTRTKLIFRLLFETGLRASEMVNLYKRNIELDKREIRGIGKGNKEYIVNFSKETAELLEFHIRWLDFNQKIFPFTRRNLHKLIDSNCKKILNLRGNPHALRHSLGTYLYSEANKDPILIQKYLRHDHLNMTQKYLHPDEAKIRKEIEETFF